MKKAIAYAAEACDMMMRRFDAPELPPKGQFHYHQGVFLSGVEKTWELTGDDRYINYIQQWIDSVISYTGDITKFNPGQLDDLQPGILLFPLIKRTGDPRYELALETVAHAIEVSPKCENGGFWHKSWYRQQMWLDGLYMGGPFLAMYGAAKDRPDLFDLDLQQAELMRQVTRDEKTGLWYHAWSENRLVDWADKETGRSPEFWGRAIGWVPVALLEEMDFIPKEHPTWKRLGEIACELLMALLPWQDEKTGLWYQVVNKPEDPRNWLETSCTCLYAGGLMKAVRLGLIDKKYLEPAKKGYQGVIDRLTYDEAGNVQIGGVCVGTGVGDYEHYLNRPVSTNDLHGVGAYLLMCAEAAKLDL